MNAEENKRYIAEIYPLIQLLRDLNNLHFGIDQKVMVQREYADGDLVKTGVPTTLSALISLLRSNTNDYAYYMSNNNGHGEIIVKHIRRYEAK